jgi:hypothetical protein
VYWFRRRVFNRIKYNDKEIWIGMFHCAASNTTAIQQAHSQDVASLQVFPSRASPCQRRYYGGKPCDFQYVQDGLLF